MPGRRGLQRMFSMFPGGSPGAGLLLLRAALGMALLAQGLAGISDGRDLTFMIWIAVVLLLVVSALLLIGFLTPVVSVVAGLYSLAIALSLATAPVQGFLATKAPALLATAIAAALVCLGPGAFSLDARLFGRREIVISSPLPPSGR
jgi:uncharacterized membrane protein YphA (DoxX/SURF4 family)